MFHVILYLSLGFYQCPSCVWRSAFGDDGLCCQSRVASPYTTIDMVSVLVHLRLLLPFPIVKALETVLESLKIVLGSAYGS